MDKPSLLILPTSLLLLCAACPANDVARPAQEGEGEAGEGEGEAEAGEGEGEAGEGEGEDTLAARYPGDLGIGEDPAVVWHEDFEAGSVDLIAGRYDQARTAGMSLDVDVPEGSSGLQALRLRSDSTTSDSTDLFRRFDGDGYDRLFVRWYVKYEVAPYHHTGMWFGGYSPSTSFPNPQAGVRPTGDDRISVALEPIDEVTVGRRMDFYNVWRGMRSWQATQPTTNDCCDWYGNTVVHNRDLTTAPNTWQCFEVEVVLNPTPNNPAGAALALWREDELVQRYTDTAPRGYFVRDKFCPADADAPACTDFAPAPEARDDDVLNLNWRTSTDLRLNWLWLLNYISDGSGSVWFDDVVVATERVGCTR